MAIEDGDGTIRHRPERAQRKRGVRFALGDETFETLPEAPATALQDLMAGVQLDGEGVRIYSAPNLIRFVQQVLPEDEWVTTEEAANRGYDIDQLDKDDESGEVLVASDAVARFARVVTSKDRRHIVPIDELGEVAMEIASRLSNRPFTPSAARSPMRR